MLKININPDFQPLLLLQVQSVDVAAFNKI